MFKNNSYITLFPENAILNTSLQIQAEKETK